MATTIGLGLVNPDHAETLKKALITNGYNVIFICAQGNEALRRARSSKPDIVILDFHLPGYPGFDLATILYEDGISSPILLLNESQKAILSKDGALFGFVSLTKPFKMDILLNTIDVLLKSKTKIHALKSEIESLRESLESRKIIERAKSILMKQFKLTEDQAHKRMQKQSMDKRVSMKEIAQAVITLYD